MEYYAKLVLVKKGVFKVNCSIWKTDPDSRVESIVYCKNFISYFHAKFWSEKKIIKLVLINSETSFIREKDVIRRRWND